MEQIKSPFDPDKEMTEGQIAEFDQKAQIVEEESDQFEVVGEDHGAKRVLSTMNFVATVPRGTEIDMETAEKIAAKHFERHCSQIGWWPSGEYPDIMVKRREDGTYFAAAYLKESTRNKVKDWEDFPRIGVDTQGSKDVPIK